MTEDAYLRRVVAGPGAFRAEENAVGAAELARRTGLPKPTVHLIPLALAAEGLLERHGSEVRLGLRLFELGQWVPRQRALRAAALPSMSDPREATGRAPSASGWSDRLCLDRVSPAVHTAARAGRGPLTSAP